MVGVGNRANGGVQVPSKSVENCGGNNVYNSL